MTEKPNLHDVTLGFINDPTLKFILKLHKKSRKDIDFVNVLFLKLVHRFVKRALGRGTNYKLFRIVT